MAWQPQKKFTKKNKNFQSDPTIINFDEFKKDWMNSRDRHKGQQAVLNAIFEDKKQYIFYLAGRKGAKTTTAIDIGWHFAHLIPKSVGYLCYPTIAQGIEVVWEERRLQTCDRKDEYMFEKYIEKTDDSRHILWFKNGSFIKLIGTWSEARGRGTQPDYLICDEFQDCNPDYIEAMDANLAAKNSPCIFMGTPPKKRNHFEDWIDRVSSNPRGQFFHFTSYDNVSLPHLKEWLDNKKVELLKAGKEDVWLREYMAELCYSSSDRVLPDAKFISPIECLKFQSQQPFSERIPILAMSIHPNYFQAIFASLEKGRRLFVLDHAIFKNVWNKSVQDFMPELKDKIKTTQDLCGKKMRYIVWDDSNSFVDLVTGFTKCRKDLKWQERGIPILREMMVKEKIFFTEQVSDFGLECQNYLLEEPQKDVEKNYPLTCTLGMLVNEYFSQEKFHVQKEFPFDKWDAFREMGIPCPPKKKSKGFFKLGN